MTQTQQDESNIEEQKSGERREKKLSGSIEEEDTEMQDNSVVLNESAEIGPICRSKSCSEISAEEFD
jgi:hypothetical protein